MQLNQKIYTTALEIYRQAALKTGAINSTVTVKAEKAKARPTQSKEYIHVYDSMADIKQGSGQSSVFRK